MTEAYDLFRRYRPKLLRGATIAALLAALLLLVPSSAGSATGVPDPDQCLVPEVIIGTSSAFPCAVMIRDGSGFPIPDALVQLRFDPAIPHGSDLCVWDLQIPPTTYSCVTNTISDLTNVAGIALFQPLFGGYVNTALVEIMANGVLLGAAKARSADFNGDGYCGVLDLAWFRYYYWYQPEAEQADFDNGGDVDLADLDAFRLSYFFGLMATPCP